MPTERTQRNGENQKNRDGEVFHKNDFVEMTC
jgi:hypothetical protein